MNRCIPSPNYSKTLKESVPISYGWPSDQDEQIKLINGDNLLPIQVLKPIPPKAEGLKFTEVSTENLLHDRLLFKSLLQLKKYIDRHKEHLERLEGIIIDEAKKNDVTKNGPRELSTEDKIYLWIDENIPNSPNKEDYKKAFEVVVNHPSPKTVTNQSLIEAVESKYKDLKVGSKALEGRMSAFKNSLPL